MSSPHLQNQHLVQVTNLLQIIRIPYVPLRVITPCHGVPEGSHVRVFISLASCVTRYALQRRDSRHYLFIVTEFALKAREYRRWALALPHQGLDGLNKLR